MRVPCSGSRGAPSRPWRLIAIGIVTSTMCGPVAERTCFAVHQLWTRTAAEQQLLNTISQGKLIRAREQAEAILRQQPGSVVALFAMAQVFHGEEGNLPRALHYAREAEQQLRQQRKHRSSGGDAEQAYRYWEQQILAEQELLLGELDRREEQLAVIARYDRRYTPTLELHRIWPLMKLHRFAEAERIAREATRSPKLERRIAGYNGLLSIAFEEELPRKSYEVAMEAVRATGEQSCILDLNTAEAAFSVFRFAEVERLALASLKAPLQDCPATAHTHLANLYLLRGDFRRAIAAVKDAREAGVSRRLRQQFEMGIASWLTRLLYALGQFEPAYELSSRVMQSPDRVGLISYSSRLMDAVNALDHYGVTVARREELLERASARSWREHWKPWWEAQKLGVQAWLGGRRVLHLIGKERMLSGMLRPYVKPLPAWQTPELTALLGAGVIGTVLGDLRRRQDMNVETEPYFAAIEGEAAYRRGRWQAALQSAQVARRGLPVDEVLLRMRVTAWAAAAALAVGQTDRARRDFDEVLHRWPTALRILSIRLPVRLRDDGDELSRRVARRLAGSPRLDPDAKLGFEVYVRRRKQQVQVCLSGPRGRRYNCATVALDQVAEGKDPVAAIIDRFHHDVFAPMIDLTQQDINSLDGSAVRGRADDVLRRVLGP